LYKSNRPSGVVHWPSGADEHHAHDPELVLLWEGDGLVGVGDGLVVVCTGLGDVVVGSGLAVVLVGLGDELDGELGGELFGGELEAGLDDEGPLGTEEVGDGTGPDCLIQ
jgi:hypothetical protein